MRIIGHGGAISTAPRNTLNALRKAIEYKVDEVEFDVRVTADKIPILHHHPDLSLPDGSKITIQAHSYSELKKFMPDVATLENALHTINGAVIAHLEVKPGEPVQPIIDVIQSFINSGRCKPTDFILASRSGRTLRQLQLIAPEIPKSVIEFWSSIRAVYNAHTVDTKRIDFLEYWLWSGLIRNLTKHGYKVCSFNSVYPARARIMSTLRRSGQSNDPKRLKNWIKAGLYGVITDYPDRFKL